ncbi:MAG TPA: PAS domain S-box protein [Thermoanaerobaculia bacterium]
MTDVADPRHFAGVPGRPEQLLQSVIDSIPHRVFWKDRNCVYLGCNRSFAGDAGVDDPALLVGRSDFDLAWKASAHLYVADDRLVMESNTPKIGIEEPMTFTDGRTIWLRTNKVPLRDAGGVFGILGTYEDITERRQAAIDLRESEERFRATFEQAAVGIAHVGPDGRFLRVNQRLCEMVGYTREELLVQTFQELTHPADLKADMENVRRMLAGEIQAYSMEKRYIRKDGTSAWIALTVSLHRDAEGEPKYFISVIEDLEPRRRVEEQSARLRNQLEQAQKMESVGQLAGGIAHDFNNLLTAILGFCELILGDESTSHRSELEEIKYAGERAAALTRQLLAFSHKQVLQLEVLDLNVIVVNMKTMLGRLIGEDVRLTSTLSSEIGLVKADASQIEQVLLNLAVNARDAMPRGGDLRIGTATADVDGALAAAHAPCSPGRFVVLTVSDTGCGMDAETQRRVFEPFFTTKPKGKGTGLGLATVYGIVKQSGGFVSFSSEPKKGTTFRVYLPRANEPGAAMSLSGASRADLPRGTETILMVEDDDGVRRLACRVLEAFGYTVLSADSGRDALEIARDHEGRIDLVLTDVVMPEMSGRELERRLAEAGHAARVLFMSGYTDDAILHHGVLKSGVPFLQKPFTPGALGRKVREVLDTPNTEWTGRRPVPDRHS